MSSKIVATFEHKLAKIVDNMLITILKNVDNLLITIKSYPHKKVIHNRTRLMHMLSTYYQHLFLIYINDLTHLSTNNGLLITIRFIIT